MIDTANHDARRILLMMLTFIRVTHSPSKGVCCQDFRKLPGPTGGEKPDFSDWLVTRPHNGPANRRGGLGKILALIFSGLLIIGVSGARADDVSRLDGVTGPNVVAPKPPEFVPIVVDQAQYSAAMTYLNGLTFKDAAPIVGWLNDQEARAKAAWVADHAAKDAAKP